MTAALVATASEWLLRTHVVPNDNFTTHRRIFEESNLPNAIFGDSQAAFGLSRIPGFVNLANLGEPATVVEFKIKAYFADLKPERVIVQANPSMFNGHYEAVGEEQLVARYNGQPVFELWSVEHWKNLAAYWRVFLTGGFESKDRMLPDGSRARDDGWQNVVPERRLSSAREGAAFRVPAAEGDVEDLDTFQALKRSVNFLLDRGAAVCLVDIPVAPELAQAIDEIPAYQRASQAIRALASNSSIKYVDANKELRQPDLFSDQNHLNPEGARIFSDTIVERCFED